MASSYQYSLRNYRAVKEADIRLDGITVVAGVNGCGKSTLSKWLYYTVNAVSNFDRLLFRNYVNSIVGIDLGYTLISREINGEYPVAPFPIPELQSRMLRGEMSDLRADDVRGWIRERLDMLLESLSAYLGANHSEAEINRIINKLGVKSAHNCSPKDIVAMVRNIQEKKADHTEEDYKRRAKERSARDFFQMVNGDDQRMRLRDVDDISLCEDGVDIFNSTADKGSRIANFLSLSRAVYVGTPMAIAVNAASPAWWKELRALMDHDDPALQLPESAEDILAYISDLLRGDIIYNPNMMGPEKLVLHTDSGNELLMSQIATGFLSFSYIYRLLANGTLNDKALLIIDEPEAHLHPQWIAELARTLVRLNKQVGVKIMIATHSPYMAEGIRVTAKGEGITDTTLFYIAEPANTSPSQYAYRCLNHDTTEIFDTFNTVYDKIDFYGGVGI